MTPELHTFARALHAATSASPRLPRALVIDASPLVRRRICADLGRLHCATRPVATALEALVILERADPVDGVVIGATPTQTRPDELAAFLAETYPRLPVVVLPAGPPARGYARDRPSFLDGAVADGSGPLQRAA
jgi:hypothetical protein